MSPKAGLIQSRWNPSITILGNLISATPPPPDKASLVDWFCKGRRPELANHREAMLQACAEMFNERGRDNVRP